MSKKELDKYDILKRLIRKEINGTQASGILKLSIRHTRRLKFQVSKQGAKGLIHGNRGRPSNRRLPEKEKQRIIQLLRKWYSDFGPSFAAEKLSESHKVHRDPKTIRQIMIDEGLWKPKKPQKALKHRSWRQRKEFFGQMQQFDGSYEYWFEERASKCCLLAAIDDATGRITKARFAADEGVVPVFGFWRDYLRKHGKPRSIYLDRFSTYKMNPRFARENHELKTQFERAMEELQIEPITAHSPQAKGRVERLFGTLQDRLIKELRLKGISNITSANQFLEKEFIARFNQKFAVIPANPANLHYPLTQTELKRLDAVFSRQTQRVVNNDFTLSYNKQWYQLTKQQPATVQKKDRVIIEQRLDGSIHIRLRGKYLNCQPLPARPKKLTPNLWVIAQTPRKQPRKPASDHPWRKYEYSRHN